MSWILTTSRTVTFWSFGDRWGLLWRLAPDSVLSVSLWLWPRLLLALAASLWGSPGLASGLCPCGLGSPSSGPAEAERSHASESGGLASPWGAGGGFLGSSPGGC